MITAGSTCFGSDRAKGMAPSLMPIIPINIVYTPAPRSSFVNILPPTSAASPMESGATPMAADAMPIICRFPSAMDATPKKNATLLMGPPISTPIMAPSTIPSGIAVVTFSDKYTKSPLRLRIANAMGSPRIHIKTSAVTLTPRKGITKIGIIGFMDLGIFMELIPFTR